jgi:acetyl-CoA acetyltransferase
MRKATAIVGIGQTEFSTNSGRSEWQLAIEAVLEALQDAGLDPSSVDGIVRYSYDNVTQAMLVRALGIKDLRWYGDCPFGGVAQCGVVAQAAAAIVSGIASTVVVYRALNERSGVRYGRAERHIADAGELVYAAGDRTPSGQFAGPYGLHVPGQCMAIWAQRYIYESDMSEPDDMTRTLAAIAIQQRRYANSNPRAMMRDRTLDMQRYREARMISAPLRLYDYCLETDGAAALVLTSADRARELRADPVYVLAAQQSLFPHSEPITVYAENLTRFGGPGNIEKLFADAGVAREDISFAELYDATSFSVLTGLETYGFAKPGEAWRLIREHGTGPDAPLPVNTHGGHLSEGYIHGINHLTEAVRQLRGTAANQLKNPELALVGSNGASSAILSR